MLSPPDGSAASPLHWNPQKWFHRPEAGGEPRGRKPSHPPAAVANPAALHELCSNKCARDTDPVHAPPEMLRQYRTNEVVDRQVDFVSDVPADFDGLLEVNREIYRKWIAQKTLPGAPANCAVLP